MIEDQSIRELYRQGCRRVLSTLIRLRSDFTLREEAMQEALASAVRQWRVEGVPDNPPAWLIRAGHRKGIDQIRRKQTAHKYSHLLVPLDAAVEEADKQDIEGDQLRLLFTCCHPALPLSARVALTLRE